MNCPCASRCPKNGQPDYCNDMCVGYLQTNMLLRKSMIPKRYIDSRIDNLPFAKEHKEAFTAIWKYGKNILEHVENGQGLYMYGLTPGTGKTTAACALGNELILRKAFTARQRLQTLFVNTSELLERLRKSITEPDESLAGFLHLINEIPLLIFDDIGTERPSDWVRERFYNIINRRNNEMKSVIFTSNLSLNQLEANLGARIRSRIEGMTFPIEFVSKKDMRRSGGVKNSKP